MELRQLRYFIALAEHLHFGRASAALAISQPALSQQIQRLERDLGTRLFLRQIGSVELTASGLGLLPRARETLRQAELCYQAVSASSGSGAQLVRVSYPVSASDVVSRMALAEFARDAADIRIELLEGSSAEGLLNLRRGDTDVAFTWLPMVSNDTDIEMTVVFTVTLQVVVSSGHRLAQQASVSWSELAGETLILFDPRFNPALYNLMRSCLNHLNIRLFASGRGVRSSETAYAASGMGFALSAPELDATVVNNPALALLPIRENPMKMQLAMHSASWNVTPAIRRFMGYVQSRQLNWAPAVRQAGPVGTVATLSKSWIPVDSSAALDSGGAPAVIRPEAGENAEGHGTLTL